jgi:transposase
MDASESALSREEMERRRLAAAQLLLGGQSQAKVARMYGVSRTTASRWHHAVSRTGVDALRKRRATGRPSRLSPEQLKEVSRIYREGPLLHGFTVDRWTTARLATVIEARFGVRYDEDHVGRMLHKLGLRNRREAFYDPGVFTAIDEGVAISR